jgi:hypothetical protein
MNLAVRVSLIAVFTSFLGCASQIHQAQTPQSPIEQEAQDNNLKNGRRQRSPIVLDGNETAWHRGSVPSVS